MKNEYKCPSCDQKLWSFKDLVDLKRNYYNGDSPAVGILSEYASSRKPFPETYQLICLNEKCERCEKTIDILLIELYWNKENIDSTGKSDAKQGRDSNGKFKSNK